MEVSAAATDGSFGSGVSSVAFYVDQVLASQRIGTANAAPYALPWDTTTATEGAHTLYAVATDVAGNVSAPVARPVTVARLVLPTAALSPSGTVTPKRKAKLTITANVNAPTYGVDRVEFYVGGTLICTDTTATYACTWTAPNAARTTSAYAIVYDGRGNRTFSDSLSIVVK